MVITIRSRPIVRSPSQGTRDFRKDRARERQRKSFERQASSKKEEEDGTPSPASQGLPQGEGDRSTPLPPSPPTELEEAVGASLPPGVREKTVKEVFDTPKPTTPVEKARSQSLPPRLRQLKSPKSVEERIVRERAGQPPQTLRPGKEPSFSLTRSGSEFVEQQKDQGNTFVAGAAGTVFTLASPFTGLVDLGISTFRDPAGTGQGVVQAGRDPVGTFQSIGKESGKFLARGDPRGISPLIVPVGLGGAARGSRTIQRGIAVRKAQRNFGQAAAGTTIRTTEQVRTGTIARDVSSIEGGFRIGKQDFRIIGTGRQQIATKAGSDFSGVRQQTSIAAIDRSGDIIGASATSTVGGARKLPDETVLFRTGFQTRQVLDSRTNLDNLADAGVTTRTDKIVQVQRVTPIEGGQIVRTIQPGPKVTQASVARTRNVLTTEGPQGRAEASAFVVGGGAGATGVETIRRTSQQLLASRKAQIAISRGRNRGSLQRGNIPGPEGSLVTGSRELVGDIARERAIVRGQGALKAGLIGAQLPRSASDVQRGTRQFLQPRTGFNVIQIPRTTPLSRVSPINAQVPKTVGVSRTTQVSRSARVPRSPGLSPSLPTIPNVVSPPLIPGVPFGIVLPKQKRSGKVGIGADVAPFKTKFSPTVTAVVFDIRGSSAPKGFKFTGLETRPIPKNRKRRRRSLF